MATDCLFCAIAAGEIPAEIVYDTAEFLAFRDINPQAPTHVLVIPRDHFDTGAALASTDPELAGRWLVASSEVAEQLGLSERGYRWVINTGVAGGQTVDHAHLHILGARPMTWPPG